MLEEAVTLAAALERALEEELARSRAEREALRTLDSDRIFAGASARAAFNARVADLQGRLAAALAHTAESAGLAEVTLARLAMVDPEGASALSELLAEIRTLAAALAEMDRLHLVLAGRALACVQGYLTALNPAPSAYDRRGMRAPSSGRPSTTSRKV
jgi:hypothetical protein